MKNLTKGLVILSMSVFLLACSKEKSSDSKTCNPTCQNGGTCASSTCNCPADWTGASCETYYTSSYVGDYISTNFNCGQGSMSQTSSVQVDPGNKNRLIIGSLYADMTDHTHFTIAKQGSFNYTGSGTIDGKTMTLSYSGSASGISASCSGNFTKK